MTLDELAALHGTDKGTKPVRSGLTPKAYTLEYEQVFEELAVKTLLEIGVSRGASIRMWFDYFPDAHIIGLDIERTLVQAHPRFSFYRGNQADAELLEGIIARHAPFDVVIDDGSHRLFDQITSLDLLFPHVRSGGLYAIEDLHAPQAIELDDIVAVVGKIVKAVRIVSEGRLALIRRA